MQELRSFAVWLVGLGLTSLLPVNLSAQGAPRFERLSPTAFACISSDEASANGALFVGTDAALLVDPGHTPAIARAFFAEAEKHCTVPIKYVVLTHWHPDHALGLAADMGREFTLIAHPSTRRALAETGHALLGSLETNEDLAVHRLLADKLIEDGQSIELGGLKLEVFCPGPAHTRGDLVVWSKSDSVLVTGDLFLRDSCPDIGGGSVENWIRALKDLEALEPAKIVPGHFALSEAGDMQRFLDYLESLWAQMEVNLAAGLTAQQAAAKYEHQAFADFLQYPRYAATFADNALAVAEEIDALPPKRGDLGPFKLAKVLQVGNNPHQINFSIDGSLAYIAVAGSDQIARVDTAELKVLPPWKANDTPLGVIEGPAGNSLLVTHFGADSVSKRNLASGELLASLKTGAGPSLFSGPYPSSHVLARKRLLLVAERADRLLVLDGDSFEFLADFPTGKRPFPPAATHDGRLAFVPNYDDGTVSVIDLWNQELLGATQVGAHPSGGVVLPGDIDYAVAVRGEDAIAFINTASHLVVDRLRDGIGQSPFSVVLSPDGRWAFVNNTASHDVSAIRMSDRKVVARIPTGEMPICMAVHPSGKTLWVSCEGTHELDVIEIPESPATPEPKLEQKTQVLVLGMIHGRARQSQTWGTQQLRETIERIQPDAVLTEIAPDRWQRIWSDWSERGVIEDPRIKLFPEYTDVLLPLKLELGFAIEPTAGWTKEMSDLRQNRIAIFDHNPEWSERSAEYEKRMNAISTDEFRRITESDDPHVIHSHEYDRLTRAELEIYDEFQNDWIGPGGWTHINRAHMAGIKSALNRHQGERVLITYGAGHKYWILDALAQMPNIEVLDVTPYLPD